jgi:hypothetical protein
MLSGSHESQLWPELFIAILRPIDGDGVPPKPPQG